jgi:uncharacterized protein
MMSKSKRGFASLPRERLEEVSLKGAEAALKSGKSHRFTSDEARLAHEKGLKVRRERAAQKKAHV